MKEVPLKRIPHPFACLRGKTKDRNVSSEGTQVLRLTQPSELSFCLKSQHRLLGSLKMFRLHTNGTQNKVATVTVLAALVVVVYVGFSQNTSNSKITFHQVNVREFDTKTKPVTRLHKYKYSWPKCQRNTSVANISGFDSLPGHIKDFLYYRHCRHFPMLLDLPDKCGGPEGSADVFLLLVIKSSPGNYDRREVLRNTWAKERLQNGVWIRRIFISGTHDSGFEKIRLNRLLEFEQRKHKDILQWDFHDSFFNLTLKQILFLEWMERNCPHVHYLLNGDDDVFANTNNMVVYLQNFEEGGRKHLFAGHLIQYVGPIREKWSKYYVPVQVHEPEKYPPYCGGGGFLLSGYTARIIYNMSHNITILPIDDVYMGLCLQQGGLRPESHPGVRTAGLYVIDKEADRYDPCYFREMLLVHRFLSVHMYVMWNSLQDPNLDCTNYYKGH